MRILAEFTLHYIYITEVNLIQSSTVQLYQIKETINQTNPEDFLLIGMSVLAYSDANKEIVSKPPKFSFLFAQWALQFGYVKHSINTRDDPKSIE